MNNILNLILKKYFPDKKSYGDFDIITTIGKCIEENNKKNFAIWGAGEHTENLYKYFSVELKDCMFIIDNNENLNKKKFLGFNVVHSKQICNCDIDTIFISSHNGRIDIKNNINKLLPCCKAIDFYEILQEHYDINLGQPFYLQEDTYKKIFNLINNYDKSTVISVKEKILKEIIYMYISIADFINAQKFIKKYIYNNYYEKNNMKNLLEDLCGLLHVLNKKLKEKLGNNILLFFLDSLRAKDVYDIKSPMKYLNNILKQSQYFTNAFSPSIFTYESVPSIFSGKLPFFNESYKRKVVQESEVRFIQEAIKKDYTIKIYSPDYWKIINGPNIRYGNYSPIMSKNIWNALCDLISDDNKNVIFLLYFLQETHPPHICGYHTVEPVGHNTPFTCNDIVNQSQEKFNIQYNDCLKYVDNQLEFYFDIMGEDITKILFSDHGQIIENAMDKLENIKTLAGWHDDRFNIPLILNGSKIKPLKYDNIFSMINFNDLIISLINNSKYDINKNYIEVNFSKICNDTIKQKYTKVGYDDYLYGFRVLRDDKYKLVITGNGKYKVYILPEQFEECRDKQVIEKVKKHFSKMVDISVPNL